VTASVTVAPSTSTDLGSLVSLACAVQPGIGRVDTAANGVSVDSCTVSLVVLALSDSLGTRNTGLPKPPAAVAVAAAQRRREQKYA